MSDGLEQLSKAGVSVWLDGLPRQWLESDGRATGQERHSIVGVTTNPTIFSKAVSKGQGYDAEVRDLAVRKVTVDEAVRSITTADVRSATDLLRTNYEATAGQDGRVSIEVDPRLAHETSRTIAEAKALWWLVDRPNTMIKIPATKEGLPAITAALSLGISVNVTLIFGLERYRAVIEAFFDGLEQAKDAGHDLSSMASVASFFVSRVDTEVDKRLDAIGGQQAADLKGRAAVANARLAFELYEQQFSGDRWAKLARAGANPQRPLWASTGVKNPAYRSTMYVDDLVAPGSVNTMPATTIDAVAQNSEITGDTVTGNYADAHSVMDGLRSVGIDYDDVVAVLERQGVQKFADSWNALLEAVSSEMGAAGAQPGEA